MPVFVTSKVVTTKSRA